MKLIMANCLKNTLRVNWWSINVIDIGNYSDLTWNHSDNIVPLYNAFIPYKVLSLLSNERLIFSHVTGYTFNELYVD